MDKLQVEVEPRRLDSPNISSRKTPPGSPFRPHPFLWNGHAQTLAAVWLARRHSSKTSTREHRLVLNDGDQLVIHEDGPVVDHDRDVATILLHGLCGSAVSSYMCRIADKLNHRGHRTFRVDWRGCGAGHGLARRPYHAGRSDDLAATIEYIQRLCPTSQIMLAGFSLGGNILLKWLGECLDGFPHHVTRAVAVNPPVDLQLCTESLASRWGGLYDRHFARQLFQHVLNTPHWSETIPRQWRVKRPRLLAEFDDGFTAPLGGFQSARDYYHRASAARVIHRMDDVPTLVLSSKDDPLIPVGILENQDWPDSVRLHFAPAGGHLGYIGRRGAGDPDRNWMDWRVVDFLTHE